MIDHKSARLVRLLVASLLVLSAVASARSAVAAPDVIVQFEGLSNDDNEVIASLRTMPPDSNLAVGPAHVFEIVNSVGRISSKSGGTITSFSLRSFFGLGPDDWFDSDPRVLYDAISGRWFATEFTNNPSTETSSIVLAVSLTSDPTGAFCRYRLGNPTSEVFLQDYPMIGMSDDKVIISYNGFTFDPETWVGGGYYVLNKADLLACGTLRFTRVPPAASFGNMHPAQSLASTSDAWGATTFTDGSGNIMKVLKFSGVPGVTTVTSTEFSMSVRQWLSAPAAEQPGSQTVETLDTRPLSVAWRDNTLWLTGAEVCYPGESTGRSCIRLLEVATDLLTARQDLSYGATGKYYYFPAMRPDADGNLHFVFSSSSATEYPDVRVTGRRATDPVNTLQASTQLRAGVGATGFRYGDYSGAAVDPSNPLIVWVAGEYMKAAASDGWGTAIAALQFTTPLTVDITAPRNGDTVSGTNWVIVWPHNFQGTPTCTIRVDGIQVAQQTCADSPTSIPWNTTAIGDGPRTLTVTITDSTPRTGTTSVSIYVANTPLTVDVTQPRSGDTVSGTNWVIVWPHNFQGTPICTIKVDGTQVAQQTCADSPTSIPWNTTAFPNGGHTITVILTDSTTRTGSKSVSVTVAN